MERFCWLNSGVRAEQGFVQDFAVLGGREWDITLEYSIKW